MNVCFIAPNPNIKDGIAKYSDFLSDKLKKIGVNLVYLYNGSNREDSHSGFYPLISYRFSDLLKSFKVLKNNKIDVVHLEYAIPTFGLLALPIICIIILSKLVLRTKIVITLHEVRRELLLLKWIGKAYYFALSLITDKFLVHTHEAQSLLILSCGISQNKIDVIPHFLFPLVETKVKRNAQVESFNVTYFGYIHVDKGIDHLIEAINVFNKSITNTKTDTKFVIAGDVRPRKGIFKIFEKRDFKYKSKIFNKVKEYGIEDKVKFIGYVNESNVHNLLSDADIFVLPYTNAEQSGVLNLLLPYQKPIIASDVGGLGETLISTGVLVPIGDANKLSLAVEKLITDEDHYKEISENYYNLQSELSLDRVAKLTNSIYEKLLISNL